MERLLKAQAKGGFQQIIRPGVLRFLDFARLNLVKDQKHSAKAQGREYVLDIFSGRATVTVETADGQKQVFSNVGARADVFSGPPVMVSPERNGATALGLTTRGTLG
jgi:5-deoxy-D-glucuronate isomerase